MKKNKKIKEKCRQLYRLHRLKSLLKINELIKKSNAVLSINVFNKSEFHAELRSTDLVKESNGENLFRVLVALEGTLGYDIGIISAINPKQPHTFIEDMLLNSGAKIFVSKIDLKIFFCRISLFLCKVEVNNEVYYCTSTNLYNSIIGAVTSISWPT